MCNNSNYIRSSSLVYKTNSCLFIYAFIVISLLSKHGIVVVSGQRFLRQGFSNNEDFGSEMKLDNNDSSFNSNTFDMTREMFIMQDLLWQIQPPIQPLQLHSNKNSNSNISPAIYKHINKYIGTNKPIDIRLFKKRGKYGLRAIGRTNDGTNLRAFWRQSIILPNNEILQQQPQQKQTEQSSSITQRGIDFLKSSYDDACRSRLFTMEFELQLPPIIIDHTTKNKKNKNNKSILPSIVYQVSLEPGSMNPKALVPRSASRIFIYPMGRQKGNDSYNNNNQKIEVGKAYISATSMKPGIVDPSWAKGRPIFRKGRNSGLM